MAKIFILYKLSHLKYLCYSITTLSRMKMCQVETLVPLPLVTRLLSQWIPRNRLFPWISYFEKEKAKAWCQPEKELVFQGEVPHSPDSVTDHFTRKTGTESMISNGKCTACLGLLGCAYFLPPPNARTLKMDLGAPEPSLSVPLTKVAKLNISACCLSLLFCLFGWPVEDRLMPGW